MSCNTLPLNQGVISQSYWGELDLGLMIKEGRQKGIDSVWM